MCLTGILRRIMYSLGDLCAKSGGFLRFFLCKNGRFCGANIYVI